MQSPFIDGVLPIDIEELFCHRSYTVHIIGVERDDTCSNDVGNIVETGVFLSFQCQFTRQTLFGLHACLYRSDHESIAIHGLT